MTTVGIIANPSSGKDIRRIVAQGWVVSDQEKIAIVRRALYGLEAAGVERVLFMAETLNIGHNAHQGMGKTQLGAETLAMHVTARQEDSTRAAEMMVAQGASCIITLGGDGTNRAVFKGSGSRIPLLPISSGTNNVFPSFQEGTTAGLAAGMLATGKVSHEVACWHSKVLVLHKDGQPVDVALVDLAVSSEAAVGSRAIWNANTLRELFLTSAQPESIGLSAIGGMLHPLDARAPSGLSVRFGEGGTVVRAAIAPGLFADINIQEHREMAVGTRFALQLDQPVTLAFDGERDRVARPGDELEIELSADGPWVVDTRQAIQGAVQRGNAL